MRDMLPNKVNKINCGVINLGSYSKSGTQWMCYYKKTGTVYYFGDANPHLTAPVDHVMLELSLIHIWSDTDTTLPFHYCNCLNPILNLCCYI